MQTTKLLTLASLCGAMFLSSNVQSQTITQGAAASKLIPGTNLIRGGVFSSNPSFIRFESGNEIQVTEWKTWLNQNFKLNFQTNFNLIGTEKDKLGMIHYRYQQVFNGHAVENGIWIVHTKAGKVVSMNGLLYNALTAPATATLSEAEALNKALAFVGATKYKWEFPEEEKFIKEKSKDANATFYPKAELVYACKKGSFAENNNHLTFKFNIYAQTPLYRADVYVDAVTGEIILDNKDIHDADVVGSAVTAYSGTQPITTDSFGGGFRLREAGRGNGIFTYNMLTGTSYGAAVDFTDADNVWNNVNPAQDEVATDAHFGAEMTYDYFQINHSRNSIDDAGFALESYVHYDVDYVNAFWDGSVMTYGDGSGAYSPLTALDIAGHEIGHGLCTFTADLVYADESGALNESFSDIWGATIEWWATPVVGDWLMGEDIGVALRNMANPGAMGDPDTYFGSNWAPLGGPDNGGVHSNSGVQNFWYYLLSTGGTGTNDNGDAYSVSPIGLTSASEITFRNLTVYLTNSSQFADARFYSIVAATDLFGGCSNEVEQTTNAWYAVGVGPEYVAEVTASYSPDNTGGCATPLTVNFTNTSSNGISYSWDFGDGGTSTAANPSHIYTVNGIYTVTLIADGGLCGIDTTIVTNQIYVGQLPDPIVVNGGRCDPGTVNLSATGSGTLSWYNVPTGGVALATGTSYTTPSISSTTTYYVEAATGGSSVYVGPATTAIGTTGTTTSNWWLVFDAVQPFTLVSVWVNANTTGNRTIELRNSSGTVLQSATINIPAGTSRITLNFNVPVGTNLQLGTDAASVPTNLLRNSSGVTYPYTIPGLVSITGSTGGSSYYYYFYDWEILATACNSDRVPVIAQIATGAVTTDDSRCGPGVVDLMASSAAGTLNWYDAPTAGTLLFTGPTYSPTISATTTYYVEEQMPPIATYNLPSNNTFGTGGNFSGDQHLVFDVIGACTLGSVKVYAGSAGNRTVQLRNSGGTVLQTITAFVPAGESRITLNFPLTPGTAYQLGWPTGSAPNLYRNNAGAVFPYTLAGLVSITGTSATAGYYYAYYDWEVQTPGCVTARVPVTGTVSVAFDATILTAGPFCSSDIATNLTAVDAGGTWTGTGITDGINGTFDPSVGAGTYPVTYTISGTCGDVGTANVIVTNLFDATITSPGTLCTGGGTINLTSADPTGTWTGTGITNSTLGTFDPSTGVGTYTVTYTITGACGAVDSEVITVEETMDATISTPAAICEGDAAFGLTAVDAGGTWSGTGVTGTNFDPSVSGVGTFNVTYTIPGACGDTDTEAFVVNSLPIASINPLTGGSICDYMVSVNLTATVTGGVWSSDCGSCINFVTGKFNPMAAGTGTWNVYYTVTGPCGTAVDTISLFVQNCTGIEEANNAFGIQILPNPANDFIQLNILNAPTGNAKISIKNSLGQLVWTSTETVTGKPIIVNVSDFNSGVYFVNTIVGNQTLTNKVVIK